MPDPRLAWLSWVMVLHWPGEVTQSLGNIGQVRRAKFPRIMDNKAIVRPNPMFSLGVHKVTPGPMEDATGWSYWGCRACRISYQV